MSENETIQRNEVNSLFVKHSPQIRGFILSLLPNMARAEDVLHETFLTVSSKADQYVAGTNFVAWACRIAQFKVLEERKRDKKNCSSFSSEVIEALCSTEQRMPVDLRDEQLAALEECLGALSQKTRRAIDLRYSRAHTIPEIAGLQGWSVQSAYVILSRARAALHQCINSKVGLGTDG